MKLLILFSLLFSLPVLAEDWTTTDGKTYKDVMVVKIEADAVTIIDNDGGALVPLATLSPELQKRFNYDPVKAKAAADARAQAEVDDAQALQAEKAAVQKNLRTQETGTPSGPQTSTPAGHLTPDQIADLQNQIIALKEDIAFMQREEGLFSNGYGSTHGAYSDKILEEQSQLAQLQAQLKAGGGQPY
jgi:hypothetical protein